VLEILVFINVTIYNIFPSQNSTFGQVANGYTSSIILWKCYIF